MNEAEKKVLISDMLKYKAACDEINEEAIIIFIDTLKYEVLKEVYGSNSFLLEEEDDERGS